MSQDTHARWLITTSSYAAHRPEFGVPVATSVGPHPQFAHAETLHALKPFGVFGVMADQPVEEQRATYQARLHKHAATIERHLHRLAATYPDQALCLLCWCTPAVARRGECHRRWCADWLHDVYGIDAPEAVAR